MVIITEFIEDSAKRWLGQKVEVCYDPMLVDKSCDLEKLLPHAKALVVRNRTQVSKELLEKASNLMVVGRLGAGLDNLDLDALHARGISAVYAPGGNSNAVAEFTVMLILALAKEVVPADTSVRDGQWLRQRFSGNEVVDKVVGIIGMGSIGQRTADLCRGLGCRVITTTRSNSCGYEAVTLERLLQEADFVSVHLPLTSQTRHLISRNELLLMKPTAYLINTARGEIVDENELYEALSNKQIAGAALDVRNQEPPQQPDRFSALENVLLTPHIAGLTKESQTAICQWVVEDVWRVLQGQKPLHPVVR